MQRPLISAEQFFSEEPLFNDDGLLNEAGLTLNSAALKREYEWLSELFMRRCEEAKASHHIIPSFWQLAPPPLVQEGPFAHFCNQRDLSATERVLLLVALEPTFQPLLLQDRLNAIKAEHGETHLSFSYYKDPFSNSYYPTLQTVLFLCAGKNPDDWRMCEQQLLHYGQLLKEQIIVLRDPDER